MLSSASLGAACAAALFTISDDDQSLRAVVVTGAGAWVMQMVIAGIILVARGERCHGAPSWGLLRALGFGVLALAITWFPLQSIGSLVASLQLWMGGAQPPTTGHTSLAAFAASGDPWLRCAMIVSAVVMAPIAEELLFRGAAQQGLRGAGFGRWWAIATTSALFAILHIGVLEEAALASGLAMLFALALVLGWLAERTGRLAAPMAAHAAFNVVNLVIGLSA